MPEILPRRAALAAICIATALIGALGAAGSSSAAAGPRSDQDASVVGSSPSWHQEVRDWFAEKRVPLMQALKDTGGRPLTRYRLCAAMGQVFADHYEADRLMVERWRADPDLDWNDVEPARYHSTAELAKWFVERCQAALQRDSKDLQFPHGASPDGPPPTFTDVPVGHPNREVIEFLGRVGVITGFPDGAFRGERQVTQMELATMFMRFNSEFERNCRIGVRKRASNRWPLRYAAEPPVVGQRRSKLKQIVMARMMYSLDNEEWAYPLGWEGGVAGAVRPGLPPILVWPRRKRFRISTGQKEIRSGGGTVSYSSLCSAQ